MSQTTEPNMILAAIVGSHAYGLNHADSDIDMLGVFQAPTISVLGSMPMVETRNGNDPDWQAHEVGKFIDLARKCNPTVTELLWLDPSFYAVRTEAGDALIAIRESFLSTKAYWAFGGYAKSQFDRMKRTGKFDSDKSTPLKVEKHARHLARLLMQGTELCLTGRLTVRLTPEQVTFARQVGGDAARGETGLITGMLDEYDSLEDKVILPATPDFATINQTLVELRLADLGLTLDV